MCAVNVLKNSNENYRIKVSQYEQETKISPVRKHFSYYNAGINGCCWLQFKPSWRSSLEALVKLKLKTPKFAR